ncbi:MAG: hypothetical protein U9R25_02120 [Chloroflexota bacterium]|nr:hypothetical protein [Chloroflexota bacterium]
MTETRDWNELERRHRAFWACEPADRPLIGVVYDAYVDTELTARAMGQGELSPDSIDPGALLSEYDRVAAARELIGDDMVAVAECLLGVPWLEAMAGCRVLVPEGKSLWPGQPLDPTARTSINFSSDNPWFRKLMAVMQTVIEHVEGRYAVSFSHLRGPADILIALLGSEGLFYTMFDDPGAITRLAAEAAQLWQHVARAQAKILPRYRGGYGVRQFGLWAPEAAPWLQDDTSSMMSEAHYRQFFLKPFRRISSFPFGTLHLHIPSLHLAETLASVPNVRAMNFYFDSQTITLQDAMPTLRKLQALKMPLILAREVFFGFSLDEYEEIMDGLSPAGLMVHMKADSVEEGRGVMAYISEKSKTAKPNLAREKTS